VGAFEPDDIKTTAPVFDLKKLEWLNGVWIRRLDPADLARRLAMTSELAAKADPALLEALAPLLAERMRRLTEFDELCAFFFTPDDAIDPQYDDLVPKKRTDTNAAAVLRGVRQVIAAWGDEPMRPEDLEARLRALGEDVGWKPRELFMSVRFAITGKKVTPPIVECMCLLGAPACIARLDEAIDVLGSPENPIVG